MNDEDRDELEYLRWFCSNADFGPADSDVRQSMEEDYVQERMKPVPANWRTES